MKRELALVMERELLGKPFKIYGTPDEPLFKARDVAEWIGHSQASVMVASVDDCEKRTLQVGTMNNVAKTGYRCCSVLIQKIWKNVEE